MAARNKSDAGALDPPQSPLRKRILSIPSKPNLDNCHVCGLGSANNDLQLLTSQWRLVLLCRPCHVSLRSGDICSYCYDEISVVGDMFFNCLRCLRRIHYKCIPHHGYFVLPAQLDVESFACVDCCPVPGRGG